MSKSFLPCLVLALSSAAVHPTFGGELPWQSPGPVCQRPHALAAPADPLAPSFVTIGSGLHRSSDGWLDWEPIGAGLPKSYVSLVAQAPRQPQRVYYAPFEGDSLYRSDDAGETWQAAEAPNLAGRLFSGLVVADDAFGTVYALTTDGVFRTRDGGATASDVTPPGAQNVHRLISHPMRPDRLWTIAHQGAFLSDDAGDHWNLVSSGLLEGPVTALAVDPHDPDGAWLVISRRLYRLVDDLHWEYRGEVEGYWGGVASLAVMPGGTGQVLVGLHSVGIQEAGLLRSRDGGETWEPAGITGESVYQLEWLDQRDWLVAATDTGLYYSLDHGSTWYRTGRGIAAARARALTKSGVAGTTVIAAVDWCGARFARSGDGGRTWHLAPITDWPDTAHYSFDIGDVVAAPSLPTRIYAGGHLLFRSDDDGRSWRILSVPSGRLAVAPHDEDLLFVIGDQGLRRSRDGGETSQLVLPTHRYNQLGTVAFSPEDPSIVITSFDEGAIARSVDGGESWQTVATTEGLFGQLVFDPHRPGRVLVAQTYESAPFLESLDNGATWEPFFSNFAGTILSLAFDPSRPGILVAGADGLYRSADGGITWVRDETAPLGPIPAVWDATFSATGQLHVATDSGIHTQGFPAYAKVCERAADIACLLEGRFEVRGAMWDFESPLGEFPIAAMTFPEHRAESDQAVFFESFDPGNFEVGVKMVDACGLDEGHPLRAYWLFAGGLTNAATTIDVEDLATGEVYRWTNPPGELALSLADTNAFPCTEGSPATCLPGEETSCLLSGRFRVRGTMRDFADPPQDFPVRVMRFGGSGRAESDQAAFFESFEEGNFEIGVKMVDACSLPAGHPLRARWAFYGGLTNAATQVVVTDVVTGRQDRWSNPAGALPRSEGRTAAFPCDP